MANIEESSREERILLNQGFRYRKNPEKNDTIYWRCFVGKCHTPIQTNVFKNSNAITVYGVGKHNHPGDRSNVYDDNRNCDDDADVCVLGSYSGTYKEWSTECPNMMLHDQKQYEKSKDTQTGMYDDYERQKNIERKHFGSVQKKVRSKLNMKMDDHTKVGIFTNELKKYMKVMNEVQETKLWITVEKNNIKV